MLRRAKELSGEERLRNTWNRATLMKTLPHQASPRLGGLEGMMGYKNCSAFFILFPVGWLVRGEAVRLTAVLTKKGPWP